MIGPLGRLGAAATLGQHCPQMTQRRCTTPSVSLPSPSANCGSIVIMPVTWISQGILLTRPLFYGQSTGLRKKMSPCLKFPPQFCLAKWLAKAQPIGPDGTFVTQLSSLYFARLCTSMLQDEPWLFGGKKDHDPYPHHEGSCRRVGQCEGLVFALNKSFLGAGIELMDR